MQRPQHVQARRRIGLFLEKLESRLLLAGNEIVAVVDDQVFIDDIADGASSRQTLDFPILVSGPRQFASRDTAYKYKIGEADEVNCQYPQGYSAWRDSSESLHFSLADYADGTNIKLCLSGSISPGPVQPPSKSTVYEWTKETPQPEIDLEKFTRVSINPIDIEKLVRVATPPVEGDICDVLGDPEKLTFKYQPGDTVLTGGNSNNQGGQATVTGTPDDDGEAYIVAANGDLFAGTVSAGAEFTLAGNFRSNTVIEICDDEAAFNGGIAPLQTIAYHTSCSQPIQFGDLIGSVILFGYDGENGSPIRYELGPGIDDDDADLPTGPSSSPGDTIVFTYVVTNSIPDTSLENVMVTDQQLAPDEQILPNPVPVEDGGFNVGDIDTDNRLDFGEVWLYTSTVEITDETAPGQYVDKSTVVSGSAMDMDAAHFIVVATPPVEGDVCGVLGAPVELTFEYDPSDVFNPLQPVPSKAEVIVNNAMDDDDNIYVIVSKDSTDPTSSVAFFEGNVTVGEQFTASTAIAGSRFASNTYVYFYDEQGGPLLQQVKYHTSCSAPIILGAELLSATLIGYVGDTGSSELPPPPGPPIDIDLGGIMFRTDDPFDPNDIGENADDPTGPIAQPGDVITWTYQVTNPGNVSLTIVSLFDDNETPEPPPPEAPGDPGIGTDDFQPVPVLKMNGFNFGDDNNNGLVDPNNSETWYYQVTRRATEPGQHTNVAKVTGQNAAGTIATDTDASNYLVNPLAIETYVSMPTLGGEDLCSSDGKPIELTFEYDPSDVFNPLQPVPSKAEVIVNNAIDDDNNIYVIVSNDSTDPTSSDAFFEGNVTVGEQFTASTANAGSSFASNTYVYFYDEQGGPLLQQVQYHTSCSAPIILGAELLSAALVGYNGIVMPVNLGDPADRPPGPSFVQGDEVVFHYAVTNRGNVSLTDIHVTDSVLGNVTDVVDNGDGDDDLAPGETWVLQVSTIAPVPGQQMNVGTATASLVEGPTGTLLTATDPAFHFVETSAFLVVGMSNDLTYRYTDGGLLSMWEYHDIRGDAPVPVADSGDEAAYGVSSAPLSAAFGADGRTDTHDQNALAVVLAAQATSVKSSATRLRALDEFFAAEGNELIDDQLHQSRF